MRSTKKLMLGVAAAALLAATACASGGGDGGAEVVTEGADGGASAPTTTAFSVVTTQAAQAPVLAADALEVGTAEALDLLGRSLETSNGRAVRGHTSMDAMGMAEDAMGMAEFGGLSLHFEVDADADVRTTLSLGDLMAGLTGVEAEGFGVEIRMVAGDVYVTYSVPEELRALLGDGMPEGWFTLDAASADGLGQMCASPIPGGILQRGFCQAPNDNTFLLEFVTTAGIVGREDLDGVSTTVVEFTVDYVDMTEAFMAEASGAMGDDPTDEYLSDAEDLFGDGPLPELVMTAWIDDNELLRRMSIDFGALFGAFGGAFADDLEDAPADMGGFVQFIDFYDYDADISIEAPPADEIVGDLSDLGDDSPLGFFEG